MTLSVACMQCSENIQADTSDALTQIVIGHYADHHYETYLQIPKTADTRGTPKVLKDRSIITRPSAVHDT